MTERLVLLNVKLNNKLENKIQFEGKIIVNLNPKLKSVLEVKFKSFNYLLSLQNN